MAENNQTNKYAYLSRLSTKELEAILRADAESPSAGTVSYTHLTLPTKRIV